ncbi:MAG: undecaprenyl-phosphate glucose phosphotransferase [Ignavibacteriales bacterium]|nr:undecaprenyl-phosphate glucose phosphotransferase [Ignavibacteriales bacterium]
MPNPRRNDFLIPTLAVIFDSIAIELAFLFSYWLRFNTSLLNFLPLTEDKPPLMAYIYGSFVIIPIWLLIFNSNKMYGARRNVALTDEFISIIKLISVAMLVVMSAAFFYRAFSYSRVVFFFLWINSIVMIFTGRIVLFRIEKFIYSKGRELRNAIIIGSNETAVRIFAQLSTHPLLGYRFLGYIAGQPVTIQPLSSSNYLGNFSDVQEILTRERIELALIALNYDEHPKLMKLVQDCEGVNTELMLVPDLLEVMTSGMKIKEIDGIPFIKIKGVPMTTWGRIVKRVFDFFISTFLLILLSWLFLLIAIVIKLNSKGKIFFVQERVGLDGRSFRMMKFRTMKVGAEMFDNESGLGVDNDPRQTSVGKILRKLSLDEFPQLINVFKGEMSLVGPRPERPYYVQQFKSLIPKYLDRHRVKTGMTGWAQVNGLRGNTSLEERIKYDIYYIENWSIGFDVKILFKTIKAVFYS